MFTLCSFRVDDAPRGAARPRIPRLSESGRTSLRRSLSSPRIRRRPSSILDPLQGAVKEWGYHHAPSPGRRIVRRRGRGQARDVTLLLDATIIRGVLLPTTMKRLGRPEAA